MKQITFSELTAAIENNKQPKSIYFNSYKYIWLVDGYYDLEGKSLLKNKLSVLCNCMFYSVEDGLI